MNSLFVLPTQSTKETLASIFSGTFLEVDLDAVGVEIGSSEKQIQVEDGVIYRAATSSINTWYDEIAGITRLLLVLYPSPEMVKRHNQVGDAWARKFIPYMALVNGIVIKRQRRAILNSLSNNFSSNLILEFHNEVVSTSKSKWPRDNNFYEDILKNGYEVPDIF